MCKWYCMSSGAMTDMKCLHCGAGYCGACLHGDGGKMKILTICARCGKKPRTKPNSQRDNWHGAPQPYEATAGTKHRVSGFEAKNGVTMKADDVHFVSSLRPSHNSYHAGASTDSRRSSATGSVSDYSSYSGSRRGSTNSNSSGRAKNDVLSRLTDASKYPGHHKHRFDEDGQGLGAMGRDRVTKGAGHIPSGLRL